MSKLSPQLILRASLARHLKEIAKENAEKLAKGETLYSHDSPEFVRRAGESEIENLIWYADYAEPGYQLRHGERGILAANWNYFHRRIDSVLETAGFETEWSDGWVACEDCGKAVRTTGDCYFWQPFYVMVDECTLVCLNCVDWTEYLRQCENRPSIAVMRACDPAKHGYHLVSEPGEFENGFHPGQDDNPSKILESLQSAGHDNIVFRIPETSQFYIKFEAWERTMTLARVIEHLKDQWFSDDRDICDALDLCYSRLDSAEVSNAG